MRESERVRTRELRSKGIREQRSKGAGSMEVRELWIRGAYAREQGNKGA